MDQIKGIVYDGNCTFLEAARRLRVDPEESRFDRQTEESQTAKLYQVIGISVIVDKLKELDGCLFADAMRMGKPLQSLLATLHLALEAMAKNEIKGPTLIVAPPNLHDEWIRTAEHMGLKVILVHGRNKLDEKSQHKKIRARYEDLEPATPKQRQKDSQLPLSTKRYDKYFHPSLRNDSANYFVVITSLDTSKSRSLISKSKKVGSSKGGDTDSVFNNTWKGRFYTTLAHEAHMVRMGGRRAKQSSWQALK